ncbi:hypothetical protein LXM94_18470 [Rhizobium sp. TRM95111]|uniref:hypothetical protein n=1 Tax=Rhizobium alarense TaxID=2846851 RepID=UPI001F407E27|nr:hypothetical protein [Rhizobium alarense]MCF3641956.1 hypothetical protein [Rhizobium alarense]
MKHVAEPPDVEAKKVREVWSVRDFARRHRLEKIEEERLRKLFGEFATKHELLVNCRRQPLFR